MYVGCTNACCLNSCVYDVDVYEQTHVEELGDVLYQEQIHFEVGFGFQGASIDFGCIYMHY